MDMGLRILTTHHPKKIYDEISDILHQEERGQMDASVIGAFNGIVRERSTNMKVLPFELRRN